MFGLTPPAEVRGERIDVDRGGMPAPTVRVAPLKFGLACTPLNERSSITAAGAGAVVVREVGDQVDVELIGRLPAQLAAHGRKLTSPVASAATQSEPLGSIARIEVCVALLGLLALPAGLAQPKSIRLT